MLHAYLHGVGVEIMANSDNVLRGGLTPKHVDVPELMHVLQFDALLDPVAPAAPVIAPPTVSSLQKVSTRWNTSLQYPNSVSAVPAWRRRPLPKLE
ncbi:MAG: hypothetical protein U1U88_001974 [Lawsonella clevelandensis]